MQHVRTSRQLIPVSDITTVRYLGPHGSPRSLYIETRHHLRGRYLAATFDFGTEAQALAALEKIERMRTQHAGAPLGTGCYMRLVEDAGEWSVLSIWGPTSLDSGFHTDAAAARREFDERAERYDSVRLVGVVD